jgi:uncharacterized protein involved in exopolysaccharide biosynthesis
MSREISFRRRIADSADAGLKSHSSSHDAAAIDLFVLGTAVVRRRRTIIMSTITLMVIAALITLVLPNTYTSSASLLPTGKVDRMAELKQLAGLSTGTAAAEGTSELFPVILGSSTVRDGVLARTFTIDQDGGATTVTLSDYFGNDNKEELRRQLAGITSIDSDPVTGVIDVAVTTKEPALSQAILGAYLEELENFNLHKRSSEARERAEYLTRELDERRAGLASAEDRLGDFQSANRDWAQTSDPEVLKHLGRLQRDVQVRTQTVLYLSQELEIARLDLQRDVPLVSALDEPSLPLKKSGPKRAIIVLVVGLTSLLAGVFYFASLEALAISSRAHGQEAQKEFTSVVAEAISPLTRTVSRLRRREPDRSSTLQSQGE